MCSHAVGSAKASPNHCPTRRGAHGHHRRSERKAEQMAAGKTARATSRVLRGQGRLLEIAAGDKSGLGSSMAWRAWPTRLPRRSTKQSRRPRAVTIARLNDAREGDVRSMRAHITRGRKSGKPRVYMARLRSVCVWVLARCRGSQGRTFPGKCAGAPFTGGHDPACPDF